MLYKELLISTMDKPAKLHIFRRNLLNGNDADIIIHKKDGVQHTLSNDERNVYFDLNDVNFITVSPMDWIYDDVYEDVDTYTNLIYNFYDHRYTVVDYKKDAYLYTHPVYGE